MIFAYSLTALKAFLLFFMCLLCLFVATSFCVVAQIRKREAREPTGIVSSGAVQLRNTLSL